MDPFDDGDENLLCLYEYGFRKGFNVQQCFIGMIKKNERVTDKGGHFGTLLTDQSKACDCLPHLIAVKLDVYGFKNYVLCLFFNYLNNRNQISDVSRAFLGIPLLSQQVAEC